MITRIALALAAVLAVSAQSNKELERIYGEDQADRENMFTMSAEQWAKTSKNDVPRRKRVRELVDAGALTTAELLNHGSIRFHFSFHPTTLTKWSKTTAVIF
jgi:hypothetical protein